MADPIDSSYSQDDWFDLDKYKQAAGVAYDFSKKKAQDAGDEQRKTLSKSAEETRKTGTQTRQYDREDEARDHAQATGAYKY